MSEAITIEFVRAIHALCKHYEESHLREELIGIGLICGDDVTSFGPFLLSRSSVHENVKPDYRFNPVDWDMNEGAEYFLKLNALLASRRVDTNSSEFPDYVREVFNSGVEAFSRLDLQKRYGQDLFVTMGGADPTFLLEKEEHRFVKLVNNPMIYSSWLKDFA